MSGLAGADNLSTLLLSNNYFECDAPHLAGAIDLGQGRFSEPGRHAVKTSGEALAGLFPFIDPFRSLDYQYYDVIVSVFSGNIQLTSTASQLPPRNATNLMQEDVMIQGSVKLFAGLFVKPFHRNADWICFVQGITI